MRGNQRIDSTGLVLRLKWSAVHWSTAFMHLSSVDSPRRSEKTESGTAILNSRERIRFSTRIGEWLGYSLFFSMLFLPTAYQVPEAALLVTVCVIIVGQATVTRRAALHPVTLLWVLAYVFIGLLFVVVGLLRDAPGAVRVMSVFVVWPLVYLVLVIGASTFRRLVVLNRLVVIGAIAIGLYALVYILTSLGVFPSWVYVPLDQGQFIGQGSGWIAIRLLSATTLFFALPYTISSLLLARFAKNPVLKTRWLFLALASGLFMVVLRRSSGFILTTAAAPVFTVVLFAVARLANGRGAPRRVLRLASGTLGFSVLVVLIAGIVLRVTGFDFAGYAYSFLEGFKFGSGADAIIRRDQFQALIASWWKHPFIGAGLGAYTPEYIQGPGASVGL